ncbi:Protein LONGIFOLIA 1 [Linum perenne]
MGLELLPKLDPEPAEKQPELRRSASESRANRDLPQYRFIDGVNFQLKQSSQSQQNVQSCNTKNNTVRNGAAKKQLGIQKEYNAVRHSRVETATRQQPNRAIAAGQRKSFYNSADFFPEPKHQQAISIYGEIEKRLRMRGIDEPSKDLETLKQILEALQLKGLLHSKKSQTKSQSEQNARARGRTCSSPTRSENGAKSPVRRRPLSVEMQRRIGNESVEQRRVSPVQSPKIGTRRSGADQNSNQSPRNRRRPAEEHKDGRNILDRCDKLLHSIAEMTAATADLQPSPVSVLDSSSFYKDESSPSPVMKRNVDFKGQLAESEDDMWSPASTESDDGEFTYVSDVLRASSYLPGDSDVFLMLEKQQYLRGKDTSMVSRLQRRLTFDTINEILKKKRELPPWKAGDETSLNQIWLEFQRLQVRDSSEEDLFEVICGVLKKDLAGDAVNGWEDCHMEMSEVVLDIERLVFKDLIGETIRDLARFSGRDGKVTSA